MAVAASATSSSQVNTYAPARAEEPRTTRWCRAIGAAPVPSLRTGGRPRLASGQNLFLSAVDSNAGVELFALTNDAPVPAADSATSDAGPP
jgi:hypothetical protein